MSADALERTAARARALREAHGGPGLLVLLNAWDAASARALAALPGCRALGTASWSIAAALGHPDGERIGREAMLAAARTIAGAVDVPVSADLEAGYGERPADVAETIAGAVRGGAAGANLEDALRPPEEHAERLAAAREAASDQGVPLVLNARTDVFLRRPGPAAAQLEDALARLRIYAEAGADCLFAPGLTDRDVIAELVASAGAPLSLLATPASPPLRELEAMGVARVSFGPGTLGIALDALRHAGEALLSLGELPAALAYRPPAPGRP